MHTPSTNQITQGRTPGMRQAIKEFNGPINMLEIGTWYGEGSTQVWLDELKSGSSITLLDSWNPYCHNDYNDTVFDYKNMDAKVHDAFIKTFEQVVSFEKFGPSKQEFKADAMGKWVREDKDIKITIIRGDSKTYLSNFADKIFDFIYIDGAHYYDNVKADIQHAKRLIKPYGIISGDDYEHDASFKMPDGTSAFPQFLEVAKQYPNNDFVSIPDTIYKIHPGVLLAIHEEFDSKVLNHDGFWWVYSNDGEFTTERPTNFK